MSVESASPFRTAGNQPHVVIPYNYADHEFARKLTMALRREGVTPWIDDLDMSAGVILINRILHPVRPVDFVIPVISAASVGSRWVRGELKSLMTREFGGRRVKVLSARIDSTMLPDFLMSQTYIDFHDRRWNQAFEDLKAIVHPSISPRPAVHPMPAAPQRPIPRAQPGAEPPPGAKVVFVSYDYENDGYYKDVLLTWAKDPDFPRLRVNDQPVTAPVESEEAAPLRRTVLAKIKSATGFLCVVGPKTNTNRWVEWETKTAIDLEKRMIVVRINRDCTFPEVLSDVGATCALSFTFEGIKRAVEEAYGVVSEE